MSVFNIEKISLSYSDNLILEGVSLCVKKGEFIGLIGPNGAGKTSLLRIMLGLESPTEGKISKKPNNIGYVPQRGYSRDNQVPLSVLEVVNLGSRGNIKNAMLALNSVNMGDDTSKRFNDLSGGQQQRVLIAKALAGNPDILLLDEPTTGIDDKSQAEFFEILNDLHKKEIAIIMVSHDIDTVLKTVDRVICLNRNIIYDGPPMNFETNKSLPRLYGNHHIVLSHKHGDIHA
jgi:zinc transport system ATP-binding protein